MNCAKFTSQAKTKVGVMSRGLGAPDAAVGPVDGDVGNTSNRAGTKERALPYSPAAAGLRTTGACERRARSVWGSVAC